jgi:hypothetical protein
MKRRFALNEDGVEINHPPTSSDIGIELLNASKKNKRVRHAFECILFIRDVIRMALMGMNQKIRKRKEKFLKSRICLLQSGDQMNLILGRSLNKNIGLKFQPMLKFFIIIFVDQVCNFLLDN